MKFFVCLSLLSFLLSPSQANEGKGPVENFWNPSRIEFLRTNWSIPEIFELLSETLTAIERAPQDKNATNHFLTLHNASYIALDKIDSKPLHRSIEYFHESQRPLLEEILALSKKYFDLELTEDGYKDLLSQIKGMDGTLKDMATETLHVLKFYETMTTARPIAEILKSVAEKVKAIEEMRKEIKSRREAILSNHKASEAKGEAPKKYGTEIMKNLKLIEQEMSLAPSAMELQGQGGMFENERKNVTAMEEIISELVSKELEEGSNLSNAALISRLSDESLSFRNFKALLNQTIDELRAKEKFLLSNIPKDYTLPDLNRSLGHYVDLMAIERVHPRHILAVMEVVYVVEPGIKLAPLEEKIKQLKSEYDPSKEALQRAGRKIIGRGGRR